MTQQTIALTGFVEIYLGTQNMCGGTEKSVEMI